MDTMIGDWKLLSSENFEELMKEMGVGIIYRKLAMTTKPNIKFEKSGDEWTFTTASAVKTTQIKYKLNEEFDEETADGRKVKSCITLDGNKLIHTQKDPKEGTVICKIVREIVDGQLKTVAMAGDIVSTRIYSRP